MTLRGNIFGGSGIFRSAIFGGAGGAPAGNGLLNNLIGFWPGNEANGNALDLHTSALHLTDVNTVTSNPGLVYPLARQYTRVNLEGHTRPWDDALLSTGDVEWTLATWVMFDSKPGIMLLAAKSWIAAGGAREYELLYDNTADRLVCVLGSGVGFGSNGASVGNTYGSPPLATWILVVGWHDPTANTINIQINNGLVDSAATTGPGVDTAMPFRIGESGDGGVHQNWLNGRIGPTMFWKSAAGGGGVLDATKRSALFNGGLGLTYAQFTL